jgi:hypothetical protein
MEINKKLLKDITQYCEYNNIEDVENEINKYIQIGFNVIRFGTAPFQEFNDKPKKFKKESPKKNEEVEHIENIKEEITQQVIEEKPKKRIRIVKDK